MVHTVKSNHLGNGTSELIQSEQLHQLLLDDVQGERDERQIPIDKAGICDIKYPIVVVDGDHRRQHTVAKLDMSVDLPHYSKGAHMSRFVEILNEYHGELNMQRLPKLLLLIKDRLRADSAHVKITFPYFLEKTAPVSGLRSLLDYQCTFIGDLNRAVLDCTLEVRVPVNALCPCSKRISDYGAHNQRSDVTISVKSQWSDLRNLAPIFITDLVEIAENSASAPVYSLVKRVDERYLTMQAFDNPVFVEDTVRSVAGQLIKDQRVDAFRVSAVNHESIHNHNAFASIEWRRSEP